MPASTSKLVHLTQKAAPEGLSKGQKLFKKLVRKIEAQREQLRAWQTVVPVYQKKYADELLPLVDRYQDRMAEMAFLLDRWHDDKAFTAKERAKLADLASKLAADVLSNDDDRPALKALFDKYQDEGEDFDTQAEEANALFRSMMAEMFDIDIGDEADLNNPEMLSRLMAETARKQAEEDAAQELAAGARRPRKKSAKQLAKEARLAEEEKNQSLSIREVYRKLASSLHPDREPDPVERARKTSLMQKVNVAYDKKDLLQLLELQLEIEQIDESAINNISEDRLKHYNKILNEQLKELDMEIEDNVMAFSVRFNRDPDTIPAANALLVDLDMEIAHLQATIHGIAADIEAFTSQKAVKSFLRSYRL